MVNNLSKPNLIPLSNMYWNWVNHKKFGVYYKLRLRNGVIFIVSVL